MTDKFSKKEAIKFGWSAMKNNLGFFIGLLIIVWLISYIPSFFAGRLGEEAKLLSFGLNIVVWLIDIIISIGLIKIALILLKGGKAKIGDLFSGLNLFFKYLFGSILYGLIVLGGLILLIVPGIIWAIKFQFFSYLIVDKGLGPIDALKRSSVITKGVKWDLFLFNIFIGLINLLGAICLLIGLFATIPTTLMAMAFVYRKLSTQADSIQTAEGIQSETNNN